MINLDGQIKAVIFDLGNVLIDIDWEVTYGCLAKFADNKNPNWQKIEQLVYAAERGEISIKHFRDGMRNELNAQITDQQFDQCWNSMIFDLPSIRWEIVRRFKQKYPVYLLSNINEIHLKCVETKPYWQPQMFDQIFWSCRMGARKPEKQIYLKVLQQINQQPQNVLFFDDRPENVEAARQLGINAILVSQPLEKIVTLDTGRIVVQ